jgi:hypothetical protein
MTSRCSRVLPEKQAAHEAWLVENYGGDMPERIAHSKAGMKDWTARDGAAFQEEAKASSTIWPGR